MSWEDILDKESRKMGATNQEMYDHHVEQVKKSLEYLINATPTGSAREWLTTTNINFMQAIFLAGAPVRSPSPQDLASSLAQEG